MGGLPSSNFIYNSIKGVFILVYASTMSLKTFKPIAVLGSRFLTISRPYMKLFGGAT
jgi:hypothetical protein